MTTPVSFAHNFRKHNLFDNIFSNLKNMNRRLRGVSTLVPLNRELDFDFDFDFDSFVRGVRAGEAKLRAGVT